MSNVYRYRVYCQTEESNVYTWDTIPPTVCPNINTHTIDSNSITIVDKVNTTQTEITNLKSDNLETLETINKNVLFNIPPFFGISSFRNNISSTGSGSATINLTTDSEIKLNCSGADDSVGLRSIQRGVYISGLTSEAGIAIRIPSNELTGNQVLKWGYFSKQNGFYFKLTSTDFQVCIMHHHVETCISRANFNGDKLDGNGKSGHLLDFSKGNIFIILFSWYGFGLVTFSVVGSSNTSKQTNLILHEYQTVGKTSTRIPNLPINITLDNNGTVANTNVYVAGRQYSILGSYTPTTRELSTYKYLFSMSHEAFLPIFSIRRKTAFIGCTIKLEDIKIKSSVDCEVRILTNATLTSNSWVENSHATESGCEVDMSSTAASNGVILYILVCFAGETVEHKLENNFELNEALPITVVCKSLTDNNGSITCALAWHEYW
jgi:hypothetical protein